MHDNVTKEEYFLILFNFFLKEISIDNFRKIPLRQLR